MKNITDRFEDFVNQLGVRFKHSVDIDQAYRQGLNDRLALRDKFLGTWRPTFPLRPSSALACGRKLSYELENFYTPGTHPSFSSDIRQSRIFKAGDIFEEYELSQIESLHNLKITHRQQRLKIAEVGGEQVTGSIDALLWLTPDVPYIIDIKTITTYQYKNIEETARPKMSNVAQLSLYACSPGFKELMGSLGVQKPPKCALLYINKDSLQFTIVEFEPNEKLAAAVISRFTKVYNTTIGGNRPPRDFAETEKYPCGKYCSFYELCQGKPDPALNIKLEADPDVAQGDEHLVLDLWQHGDSSTYESPSYLFTISKLKTKWSVDVVKKDMKDEVKKPKKKSKRRSKNTSAIGTVGS